MQEERKIDFNYLIAYFRKKCWNLFDLFCFGFGFPFKILQGR